jgi:hypothetical protein
MDNNEKLKRLHQVRGGLILLSVLIIIALSIFWFTQFPDNTVLFNLSVILLVWIFMMNVLNAYFPLSKDTSKIPPPNTPAI